MRIRFAIISLFMIGVLSIVPGKTFAHGDIDEQIISVTQRIKEHPTDPALYIKRGDLYRIHQDWRDSLADFKQAHKLSPQDREVHFHLGRLWWESGQLDSAKRELDIYLQYQPDSVTGLVHRARVLAKMNHTALAVKDISKAILRQKPPLPDLYLDRKEMMVSLGQDHQEETLKGIEQGIVDMGHLVVFLQAAMEIEIDLKRYDAALRRFAYLPKNLQTLPYWVAMQGDVYLSAGRKELALKNYSRALESIENYPKRKRNVKATLELESRIRKTMSTIAGATSLGSDE